MAPSDNDREADDGKLGLADEMQKLREKWERLWALKDSHEYQLACHAAVQANKLEFALNDDKSGGSSDSDSMGNDRNGEDGDSEDSDSESSDSEDSDSEDSDSEDSDSEDDVGDGHGTFDQCTVSATVSTLRMTAIAESRVNPATFRSDILDTILDAPPLAYGLLSRHGTFRYDVWGRGSPYEGTGVWHSEFGQGLLVYIEEMQVKHFFRGMGIGTKLFNQALDWVGKKAHELGQDNDPGTYLVVVPAAMISDLDREFGEGNFSQAEVDAFEKKLRDKAVAFWRKQGFRRVGLSGFYAYATNPNHPSRQLTADEDSERDGVDPPRLRPGAGWMT